MTGLAGFSADKLGHWSDDRILNEVIDIGGGPNENRSEFFYFR